MDALDLNIAWFCDFPFSCRSTRKVRALGFEIADELMDKVKNTPRTCEWLTCFNWIVLSMYKSMYVHAFFEPVCQPVCLQLATWQATSSSSTGNLASNKQLINWLEVSWGVRVRVYVIHIFTTLPPTCQFTTNLPHTYHQFTNLPPTYHIT